MLEARLGDGFPIEKETAEALGPVSHLLALLPSPPGISALMWPPPRPRLGQEGGERIPTAAQALRLPKGISALLIALLGAAHEWAILGPAELRGPRP